VVDWWLGVVYMRTPPTHYCLGSSEQATYMVTHPYNECSTHGPRAMAMKNLRALKNHPKAIPRKSTELQICYCLALNFSVKG
jgi:hypothetical protein